MHTFSTFHLNHCRARCLFSSIAAGIESGGSTSRYRLRIALPNMPGVLKILDCTTDLPPGNHRRPFPVAVTNSLENIDGRLENKPVRWQCERCHEATATRVQVLTRIIFAPQMAQKPLAHRRLLHLETRDSIAVPTVLLETQEVLARNYGLSAQLNCLDYCGLCKQRLQDGTSSRWVLADLSRDEIQRLQKASGEREIGQPAWRGFIEEVGRERPPRTALEYDRSLPYVYPFRSRPQGIIAFLPHARGKAAKSSWFTRFTTMSV